MVYFLCALLGTGILAAICVPLFGKGDTLDSAILEETEWDLLQRKKEVILGNVQDLDFEYKCGKLSDGDYHQIRSEMMGEAAETLGKIDTLESSLDLDTLIRREVASRKAASRPVMPVKCAACGSGNPSSNRFCAECGAKLSH